MGKLIDFLLHGLVFVHETNIPPGLMNERENERQLLDNKKIMQLKRHNKPMKDIAHHLGSSKAISTKKHTRKTRLSDDFPPPEPHNVGFAPCIFENEFSLSNMIQLFWLLETKVINANEMDKYFIFYKKLSIIH